MNFVKSYLSSQICFRQVSTYRYEEYQRSKRTILFPLTGDPGDEYETVGDVLKYFKDIDKLVNPDTRGAIQEE
jgi:hypothetical protein